MRGIQAWFAVATALLGCADCPAGPVGPGLVVEVYDETTGARPATFTVVARAGAYVVTAQGIGDFERADGGGRALLAWGRAGTYTVEVDAVGYQLWMRTGVRVRDDGCLVRSTVVRMPLRRSLSNNTQLGAGPGLAAAPGG